jgi:hypothetical protein
MSGVISAYYDEAAGTMAFQLESGPTIYMQKFVPRF